MADLNPRKMKETAARRLSETTASPGRLVLIHTGVTVALNLLVNWLNLMLSEQIGTTGGLSGLGIRSVLQTIQTVLEYFATFFTPFWQAGFLYAMISIARGKDAPNASLLRGFRRFGRILSYVFWQILIVMSLSMGLIYLVSFVFTLTPFSRDFLELLEPLMQRSDFLLADGTINLDILPMEDMLMAMIPMLVMFAAAFISLYTFLSYQFRMALFLLVEGIERGSFGAFVVSTKLMKGHKWQMLKLDLSFWWYYALELLLLVVLYLDLILPLMGVALPINATAAYFTTIALYGVLELALHLWKKAEVDVTYTAAYEAIYREFVPLDPQ